MTTYRYPDTPAGEEITETMLQAALPTFIEKTDTVGRNNVALAADVDLVLPVPASSRWWIEMHLVVAGTNTAKIKTDWTVPAGTSGNRRVHGPGSSAATQTDADNTASRWGVHGFGTAITFGLPRNAGSLHSQLLETALVAVGTSAGSIALRWAQSVADAANPTFVQPGSLIKAYRLA